MDLSICILTYNQPLLLPQCVAACLREIGRTRIDAEILIVDNGSQDAYPQKLADLSPMIRVIRKERGLGFSAANNEAIRASHGRYVLILNDDAILKDSTLRLMLEKIESSLDVAAVGPKFVYPDGSWQKITHARFPHVRHVVCEILMVDQFLERNALTRNTFTLCRNPEVSGEAEHLTGACLLIRRAALDSVGLFDEGFQYYFEDTDLCYRLVEAGWKLIYLAEAQVVHRGSASFKSLDRTEKRATYFGSMLRYFKRRSSPQKYTVVRLTLGVALLARMMEVGLLGFVRRGVTCGEAIRQARFDFGLLRSLLNGDLVR